jgi:hypothetical protein
MWLIRTNTDRDNNQFIYFLILSLTNNSIIMFTTTSKSMNVFNDKDVIMLLVVDDHSGDQRSQLIFLLDLILISVLSVLLFTWYLHECPVNTEN